MINENMELIFKERDKTSQINEAKPEQKYTIWCIFIMMIFVRFYIFIFVILIACKVNEIFITV